MKSEKPKEAKNGHFPREQSSPPLMTILPNAHPLAGVIGGFADDPLWDEFLAQMEQSRKAPDHPQEVVK